MENVQIDRIAQLAETVAANAAQQQDAITEERKAAAALLDTVVAKIKPALRALSSRILSVDDSTGGRNGCNPVEIKEYHDVRGLLVLNTFERVKDATGNEGHYEGDGLYLLESGEWAMVERSGTWSLWQGSWDRDHRSLPEIVPTLKAVRWADVEEIVTSLATKLTQQADGASKDRAKAARERAAKLTALTALL